MAASALRPSLQQRLDPETKLKVGPCAATRATRPTLCASHDVLHAKGHVRCQRRWASGLCANDRPRSTSGWPHTAAINLGHMLQLLMRDL
jgi:hypothetical protein